jgi:sortase A
MKRLRTRTSKTHRWIEVSLLLAGLAGVGTWGWSHVRMAVFQSWGNRVLDHSTGNRPATGSPPGAASHAKAPPLPNGALIGRLAIPRLKMRSVVREGAGEDTLDVALGHIPGTALPGQTGNTGIAGHRDTLFRGLRNIEKDDVIEFQTPAGSYHYKVESTGIVKPDDVAVLHANGHTEMTLVTCYPFYYVGAAPKRFIVKARLVEPPIAPSTVTATAAPAPPPTPMPVPQRTSPSEDRKRRPAVHPDIQEASFRVSTLDTRELAPGILLRLTWTDPLRRRANGWLSIPREGRTIWLWNQAVRQPVFFRAPEGGVQHELLITGVTKNSATGILKSPTVQ